MPLQPEGKQLFMPARPMTFWRPCKIKSIDFLFKELSKSEPASLAITSNTSFLSQFLMK